MKLKLSFLTLSLVFAFAVNGVAQTEIKINPLGLFFGLASVDAEFGVSDAIGIEPGLTYNSFKIGDYKTSGFGVRVLGKYYFNEDELKGWSGGVYMRFGSNTLELDTDKVKNTVFAGGIMFNYKWVTKRNIIFELGLGAGRNFVNNYSDNDNISTDLSEIPLLNIDIPARFSIGYRF